MSERLPDFLEVTRLARQGAELAGKIQLARMPRLLASLESSDGQADVHLHFGVDEQGLAYVRGRVDADVRMVCQRCLQPLTLRVGADITLALVMNDAQAADLPDEYEPLVVEEGRVATTELVEDELLLALPIVPLHERDQCPAAEWLEGQAPAPEPEVRERSNPFAALSALKAKKTSE